MSSENILLNPWASPQILLAIAILALLVTLLLATGRWSWRGARYLSLLMGSLFMASLVGWWLLAHSEPDAIANQARPSVTETPEDDLYAHDAQHFIYPYRLFGQDIDKARMEDARMLYGDFLDEAKIAQLASFPDGGSVLAARFNNAARVAEAARAYLQRFRVEMATGDLTHGLRGERSDMSDRVELLLDGDMLVAWTARTEAALAIRRWSSEAGNPHQRSAGNK